MEVLCEKMLWSQTDPNSDPDSFRFQFCKCAIDLSFTFYKMGIILATSYDFWKD